MTLHAHHATQPERRAWITPLLCSLLACMAVLALWLATPLRALASDDEAVDPYADAMAVDWGDGTYLVEVALEGGTGRVSIKSPTYLTVRDGKATAEIEWSSPHYDYMAVGGKRYLPLSVSDETSLFAIPVLALDAPFDVIGDTTAMSEPHEIAYQLSFDAESRSLVASLTGKPNLAEYGAIGAVVVVAVGAAGFFVWRRKRA